MNGRSPIYLRYTVNRKPRYFSIKKKIDPKYWKPDGKGYVARQAPNSRELNYFLHEKIQKAESVILELDNKNIPLTFENFKQRFWGESSGSFREFCEQIIEERAKMCAAGTKYKPLTILSYRKHLPLFIRYAGEDVAFHHITTSFLETYKRHLFAQGLREGAVWTRLKFLRTMYSEAQRRGLVSENPFKGIMLNPKHKSTDRLTLEELNHLQKLFDDYSKRDKIAVSLQDSHYLVMRYFLFSCYTRLPYIDYCTLDYKQIEPVVYNNQTVYVIVKKRVKTGEQFFIPLNSQSSTIN